MANFYATARSNYFKVKDLEAFKKHAGKMCLEVHEDGDGLVMVHPDECRIDCGGWPSSFYGELEDSEFDVADEISQHLADGEVAIFMESGHEKLRYVSGIALAINSAGETKKVDMDDIHGLAKELTDRPDDITRAEY